jgi:hypothetical protein
VGVRTALSLARALSLSLSQGRAATLQSARSLARSGPPWRKSPLPQGDPAAQRPLPAQPPCSLKRTGGVPRTALRAQGRCSVEVLPRCYPPCHPIPDTCYFRACLSLQSSGRKKKKKKKAEKPDRQWVHTGHPHRSLPGSMCPKSPTQVTFGLKKPQLQL